jgi:hypothetical protein
MQTDHNPNGGLGASLSRRKLFQIAAASTAATLPVAASAAVAETTSRLPQLTDEQQLENCVAQLRAVLQRMHPTVSIIHPHYASRRQDGSFRFSLQGDVQFQEYDGEGLYDVSMDGCIMTFWLWRDVQRSVRTGLALPGSEFCWGLHYYEGEYIDNERHLGHRPNIVRKIEGGPSPWSE